MNMLLAFAPFLAFALLERVIGTPNALMTATAISALLIVRETVLNKKGLKPLEAVSLVMFGGLAILTKRADLHLSVIMVRLIVDGGLLAFVLLSLLIGKPFTLAYAKDQVSADIAQSARFHTINGWLSALWALAFAAIVAADAAMVYVPSFTVMAGAVVTLGALAVAALLTSWLPKAMVRKSATKVAA